MPGEGVVVELLHVEAIECAGARPVTGAENEEAGAVEGDEEVPGRGVGGGRQGVG